MQWGIGLWLLVHSNTEDGKEADGASIQEQLNPPSLATKCFDQFHIESLNSHVAVITAPSHHPSIPRSLAQRGSHLFD
jgi:hypothetical protein